MIKAVFVDVDGTILDFDKCADEAMRRTFADFSLPFCAEVVKSFHEINDSLWKSVERGEIPKSEVFERRWKETLAVLEIDFDFTVVEKKFFGYISEIAEPFDGACELLKYLSEKYTVCIASNAGFSQQRKRLTMAGMFEYVDFLFTSEKIGAEKPEKAFFDACFAELDGVLPRETVIIGDSQTADILGGKNCGIKTIWFNPRKKEPICGISADFEVDSLDKIRTIL